MQVICKMLESIMENTFFFSNTDVVNGGGERHVVVKCLLPVDHWFDSQ